MSAPRANPLNTGYDQSLLAATPEVSKAAKQEGYNVDLLDEPHPVRGNHTPALAPEAMTSKENYNALSSGDSPIHPRGRVPFWRTRGGMITLAVLAIVIVGAVVGGAVGGTVSKGSKKEAASKQGTSAAQTNGTSEQVGPGSSASTSASAAPSSGTGGGTGAGGSGGSDVSKAQASTSSQTQASNQARTMALS